MSPWNVSGWNQVRFAWDAKWRTSKSTLRSAMDLESGTKTFGVLQVSFVLRNLVLEDDVVAKRIPRQFRAMTRWS